MRHAPASGERGFQLHGTCADGSVSFRKKFSRGNVLDFLASQLGCEVAMEACASAHYWGREIAKLGHDVKLIAPIYAKPFVKRKKNNTTDAEEISEAAQRPTMTFVVVKTAEQPAGQGDVGYGSPGQQDGAHCLGGDDYEAEMSGSCRRLTGRHAAGSHR